MVLFASNVEINILGQVLLLLNYLVRLVGQFYIFFKLSILDLLTKVSRAIW
jgi:hypothetical protein